MSKSAIEWTDRTDNPIHLLKADGSHGGHWCQKTSAGCKKCYAEAVNSSNYFKFASHLKYSGKPPENLSFDNAVVEKWKTATKPWKRFVCSMTDLFGEWVPYEWQHKVFDEAALAPTQTIQLLTKRPGIALEAAATWMQLSGLDSMPSNIWMGVTIEDSTEAENRWSDVADLAEQFSLLWISHEPGLSSVDWHFYSFIDWMVIGGESGPGARDFHLAHAQATLEWCKKNEVAAFFKQMGDSPILEDGASGKGLYGRKGKDFDAWPEWAKVREFPN